MAGYLGVERAIEVDPDDILIVSGAQQARDLIARVLLDEGDGVVVEEPCHWSVRHTYEAMGARIVPCQVGAHGLDIERHAAALDGVRLVNVAPSFQFPTGVVMPEERRTRPAAMGVRARRLPGGGRFRLRAPLRRAHLARRCGRWTAMAG